MAWRRLSDEQWLKIGKLIPKHQNHPKGGRPFANDRSCLDGIIWLLWTGCQWSELPKRYPSYSTCWRRLQYWQSIGVLKGIWKRFLADLNSKDQVAWDEFFIDGTFASAKSGGDKIGKTKRGKGTKIMLVTDGNGTPMGLHIDSASPAEVTLIDETLSDISVGKSGVAGRPRNRPDCIVGDKAYDSNKVRNTLAQRGITPTFPARSNNRCATHQDGRRLRRYKNRWKVERSISWLQDFRRIVVRYERKSAIYLGLLQLACALIVLRKL